VSHPIANILIDWYQKNRRDLPWRHTKEPYCIWLSEIILQQTRVDQGLPYFEKFMEAFPDIYSLASAPEDKVLKLWQGLGYYSRARNLHFTAKYIVSHLGGHFPGTAKELEQLKGIGPYTAAAIASFSYGESVPVLDGNVYRVVSRLFAVDTEINAHGAPAIYKSMLEVLINGSPPDEFNQSIMEFGALQCTPQQPGCHHCPLNMQCAAHQQKTVSHYPKKIKLKKITNRYLNYFFIHDGKRCWMQQRDTSGIWKGLYDLPCIETDTEMTPEALFKYTTFLDWMKTQEVTVISVNKVLHKLTHRHLHVQFIELKVKKDFHLDKNPIFETKLTQIETYPVSRLIENYLRTRLKELYEQSHSNRKPGKRS
jgi:A/G-specific adenine glycosylase